MSNKNIGIKDVAVAAGVSVTTVSHVLNEVSYARIS
ncbi:LacI family DNA-binding transcriptional regulator, partial [Paenarthrobacter sp. CM16]